MRWTIPGKNITYRALSGVLIGTKCLELGLSQGIDIDPLTTYTLLLNQKFLPQYLEGEYKELFASYIKTRADLGHFHIQFNVIDRKTLLEAQKNPVKYADLVVRLAGYSVYFVDLPKMIQDEIVNRTEQEFH
jgi:formate C-acetyltransferase